MEPDSKNLFLPDESLNGEEREHCVHSELVSDTETFQALEVLGLKSSSANKRFEKIVEIIMRRRNLPDKACSKFDEDFWINSQKLSDEKSVEIVEEHLIQSWRGPLCEKLRVRTQTKTWHPFTPCYCRVKPCAVQEPGMLMLPWILNFTNGSSTH